MTITFERERVRSFVEFPGADLYGDPADERFSITSPIEALERMLDSSLLPVTEDVREWLKQEVFMEVAAFATEKPSPRYDVAENLREWFGEEYGDEDGDDRLTDEQIKELEKRSEDLVDWYLSVAKVYRIEQLRQWSFDKDDILELVEKLRPDWLTDIRVGERSGNWIP